MKMIFIFGLEVYRIKGALSIEKAAFLSVLIEIQRQMKGIFIELKTGR